MRPSSEGGEDPGLVEDVHAPPFAPGEDGPAEAPGRVGSVEGTLRSRSAGTGDPGTSSARKAQVSGPWRRTTSLAAGPGPQLSRRVDVEEPVERDAELQLASEADQAGEDAIAPARDPVDRPGRRHLGHRAQGHREPFPAEPEDQEVRLVGRGGRDGSGQEIRPFVEITLGARRRKNARAPRRRRGSSGNGRARSALGSSGRL